MLYSATRGLSATVLVILNHDKVRMIPERTITDKNDDNGELAPPSPNFHTTLKGECLSIDRLTRDTPATSPLP
ncbi:hypothetical protein TNCV_698901 [Trichonephila clavipes]|nr:hypothetical protein TNCV_698901 [Trichonephila clavipes]